MDAFTIERRVDAGHHRGTLRIRAAVRPLASTKIIISIPGVREGLDGYNGKYATLAESIAREGIGAVLRTDGNREVAGIEYSFALRERVRATIEYALQHSEEICGSAKPAIYLMGYSAGASGAAAVAHEYDMIPRVLLLAPAGDAGTRECEQGLAKYQGTVHIAVGDRDEIVGARAGRIFYEMATGARERTIVTIPDCDHQFRGERNGRIMSKAPLWAFAGDMSFPDPQGGIKLYD